MEAGIATCINKCLTYLRMRDDYQNPSDLLVQPEMPHWKWEDIAMDFTTSLPKTTSYYYTIWKCLLDVTVGIPLDEIQIDDKLHFVEEPIEIMDRDVKRLKQSRIHYVKVRWNSRRGPELTREHEDRFPKKYPHLIANLHHRQMPQLELWDEAHLTGKGCHTP
ncbi:hypothetical protein Tco_0373217 [Tanacetum coccineum]